MKKPLSTPNAMARFLTFAATFAAKSFFPRPQGRSQRPSPEAVAGKTRLLSSKQDADTAIRAGDPACARNEVNEGGEPQSRSQNEDGGWRMASTVENSGQRQRKEKELQAGTTPSHVTGLSPIAKLPPPAQYRRWHRPGRMFQIGRSK